MILGRSRRLKWLMLASAVYLCSTTPLHAITPADFESIRSFPFESWSYDGGLPSSTVTSVAQTRDGYLWIGTDKGLVRFDGVAFTLLDSKSAPALPDAVVITLEVGPEGTLWIGTMKGLASLNGETLRTYTRASGLPDDRITELLFTKDGTFFVGTPSGLARSVRAGKKTRFETAGLAGKWVTALAEDRKNGLWVGTFDAGLFRQDAGSFERTATNAISDVRALRPASPTGVWVGTRREGLFRVQTDSVARWTVREGLSSDSIYALLETSDGSLWVGTNGGGLDRYRAGRFESLGVEKGPKLVKTLFQDREGNVWAGSLGDGLTRVRQVPFLGLTMKDGLASDVVYPVHETRTGELWAGSPASGASRRHRGRWTRYDTSSGLRHNAVLTIHDDPEGNVWIGTAGGGLARFRDGRFTHYTSAEGLADDLVRAVLPSRDGSLWVGTFSGSLHRMVAGRISRVPEGSSDKSILTLLEDRTGTLWIGTEGAGLIRRTMDGARRFTTKDGLPAAEVSALHEDSTGAIWIGTREGLTRWKNGILTTITKKHGLSVTSVQQILEDDFGYLWLGGEHEIERVAIGELHAVADGRAVRLNSRRFGVGDGLPTSELVGGVFPAGWKTRDGLLLFPTMKGLAVTDARPSAPAAVARPLIERVTVRGKELPWRKANQALIPPRVSRLEIRFTAPSFSDPTHIDFRYKLDGFDEGWVEAGNRRFAEYTRLPPRTYTFRVAARNPDGEWSKNEAELSIEVAPAFFETRMFVALVGVSVLLLALFGHRWRTRALHDRHAELMALIEDRARAEEALSESEKHFRALIENASDLVMIVSRDGTIEYVSPTADRFLGRTADQTTGAKLKELVHPGDLELLDQQFFRGLQPGDIAAAIVRIPVWDGPDLTLELFGQRLSAASSDGHLLINCRDVTQRKTLERRLEQANRVSSLGRLAATVSHEFNNVLMGIRSMAEMIVRSGKPELAAKILESVDRGRQVTEEILRYARESPLICSVIDLKRWSEGLAAELRQLLGDRISVQVTSEDLFVWADPRQLMQVFVNLALNARDAMEDHGMLSIRIHRADPALARTAGLDGEMFIEMEVEDTGKGIPPDVMAHIFEPLFTTKKSHGTGLGLAVVHQIVEKHGGHIAASSEIGKGTVFHIVLPACEPSRIVESVRPEASQPPPFEAAAISLLLIEDDTIVAEGLKLVLTDLGCAVHVIDRGEGALSAIAQYAPGVVVLDVGLPDMDGTLVFEQIDRHYPDLPVVFSTGHAEAARLQPYLRRPNVSFIRKPYEVADLMAKIQEIIRVPGMRT